MIDPLIILAALLCGLLARAVGLPALIGYLAAGFVLHELNVQGTELLASLSEIGITLLLFSIGLKLQPRELLRTNVWGTTLVHMAVMQLIFLGALYAAASLMPGLELEIGTAMIIAFALTFSSTVFVIQIMQERGEISSRHATLAIGVLIIQDLAAVLFLAASAGKVPAIEALFLLALIPLRKPILKMLSYAGHGDLFTLFGFTLALVGAQLFEMVDIKGDLGALIIGALLAGHQKAKELSRHLLYFKDLFLVCFFLQIGLLGWPDAELIYLSIVIGALAVIKPLLYFPLMTVFHTPARTALLASGALTNFSEFGLIVIAVAASSGWVDPQWSSALSLIIAISFLIASPVNSAGHRIYRRYSHRLQGFESGVVRAQLPDTSGAQVFILGMGRIGTGAYEEIAPFFGRAVVGVDDNDRKLAEHHATHRRVVGADASNPDFWSRVKLNEVKLVMLALTNQRENLLVAKLLRELGYRGEMAAVVRFSEEEMQLEKQGISAFNLYAQAGAGFAEHALKIMPTEVEGQQAGGA